MANIPGGPWRPPGYWGIPNTIIRKTEKGYTIGWENVADKPPFIEGSAKEIARDLIVRCGNSLKLDNESIAIIRTIPFYASIHVEWQPTLRCTLASDVKVVGCKSVDFLNELTEELKKLAHLLLFV